jgi:hypothetical protein
VQLWGNGVRFTIVLATTMLCCGTASAEPDQDSANFWMPACRELAFESPGTFRKNPFDEGWCLGIVNGLSYLRPLIGVCQPDGTTPRQALLVVVKYIDQRPERMNENFKALAVEALRAAWPCQRKRMRELNDDVERRTTSMGLFNTAEAYRLSAIKLRAGKKVKTGHADTPVRLLYYHALELYLKALLRQKYSVKTLRERIKATTGDAVPSRFQSTDLDPELVRKPL